MSRSKLALLLLVPLVLSGGAFALKDRIALSLFREVAERQIGFDARDGLDDGLHVAFCGTGTPLPDASSGGGCTAVIAGRRVFLFDAGEGTAENLALMGIVPSDVEKVFLTHFHSDHINGLGALAVQHVFRGGVAEPLQVFGGPGIDRVVAGFNEAFALDHRYRSEHHGADAAPISGFQLAAHLIEPMAASALRTVLEEGGVSIKAFAVPHGPVSPAFGYRIDYRGRSVVVSGDTSYSESLVAAAEGADLLIHEALNPVLVGELEAASLRHARSGLATVMHDIPSYHTTPEEAATAASRAGVRALALTHLIPGVPGWFFESLFLGSAAEHFDGPLWLVADGDLISIPIEGEMRRTHLL